MPGNRDEEIIEGFERLHGLAKHLAHKFHKRWFSEKADLNQAAALAALETIAEVGEATTLREACRIIRHHLRQQEHAYGRRQERTIEGKVAAKLHEIYLSQFTLENGQLHTVLEQGKSISDFSNWAARDLHRRANQREQTPVVPTERQRRQKIILDNLLKEDPNLKKLYEHMRHSPHRTMAEIGRSPETPANWTVAVLSKNRNKARQME